MALKVDCQLANSTHFNNKRERLGSPSDRSSHAHNNTRQHVLRKLFISIIFVITNIIIWHRKSLLPQNEDWFTSIIDVSQFTHLLEENQHHALSSGVGMVTRDGLWNTTTPDKYKKYDIKILGFTDSKYKKIALAWYNRLSVLGYNEHYVVAHDEGTYNELKSSNVRVLPCFISNPDTARPVLGLWQQIMAHRLHMTMDLLKNGTHLLITDVDNVFSRYVPLYGFLEEGYDVFHAYEMRYPMDMYNEFGFVVCSGHQFLRSSPGTLKFMELMNKRCPYGKCDDQVTYNRVFHLDLKIDWDNMNGTTPNKRVGALRVNTSHVENGNLLVESITGRSTVTNHTVKVWDRDFAWRLAGCQNDDGSGNVGAIPDFCPSLNNWLGMPTKCDSLTQTGDKINDKLAQFEVWDKYCRLGKMV